MIGLGKSGRAAAELLAKDGHAVYASDAGREEAAVRLTALAPAADPAAAGFEIGARVSGALAFGASATTPSVS